ncbi:hypothetical protein ACGFZK_04400 [Streptomyces sp. NPDC048257]|uniref:hypothetical protein n=1 Tax=Streptomyces sp. NPDC048257 TaxID=3365526 RepID=UPI0037206908
MTAGIPCRAAGLATAVWALAGGLALHHAAHAVTALRFGRCVPGVAVRAVPGIAIPVLVAVAPNALAPWLLVLLPAAEAIAHLLYARTLSARRRKAAAA